MSTISHLILCGPTRTATTSLYRQLSQDELFNPSRVKELDYFLPAMQGPLSGTPQTYLENFVRPGTNTISLEASPLYFGCGKPVAEAIAKTLGENVGIVMTLRNPYERLISTIFHIMTKRNIHEQTDPAVLARTAIDSGLTIPKSKSELNAAIVRESSYRPVLEEWLQVFPADRIRIVFYDHLTDPERFRDVASSIYGFVGREHGLAADELRHENQTRLVKNSGLHKTALAINNRLEPILNRVPGLRTMLRDVYYAFNERRSKGEQSELAINAELRSELTSVLDERNRGLGQLLRGLGATDLPAWADR
ncbi:sulfotransferase domain-containing protein [Planctomicrobium piriforme]|uniref:Sulfotransferase domain-containing protein n=1 Tax=Planctomicrobium piriforme TaxID=1576369 RepID=A0A1I3DDV2_9PLAN|nr:sulfotransferase domain-containing protein [Planctomicrobium piriforme]SFH84887.1 Sulfotransferase domain-containing protein [Planctomicrobium piriforme]